MQGICIYPLHESNRVGDESSGCAYVYISDDKVRRGWVWFWDWVVGVVCVVVNSDWSLMPGHFLELR